MILVHFILRLFFSPISLVQVCLPLLFPFFQLNSFTSTVETCKSSSKSIFRLRETDLMIKEMITQSNSMHALTHGCRGCRRKKEKEKREEEERRGEERKEREEEKKKKMKPVCILDDTSRCGVGGFKMNKFCTFTCHYVYVHSRVYTRTQACTQVHKRRPQVKKWELFKNTK